jgi:hypothetical protein
MTGITAMGTTYNLPNYTGMLYGLTPYDTPLLSAIGGLAGGGQTASTEFEWEFYDLRAAGQNVQLEGATAPTAQNRVRANKTNVTQIHQEKVSVSYSKQAAVGQKSGTNNALPNPITNELDWQVEAMLKQMARDVNWSFIRGAYNKPNDNTTKRQTAGLLSVIQTNNVNAGTVLGTGLAATASTDLITLTAHGLTNGQSVRISTINTPNGLSTTDPYFVVGVTANTFKLALTNGGAPVDITADSTVTVTTGVAVTTDAVDTLLQSVYDNGGISEGATATLLVGSAGKRRLTKAYATTNAYREMSRNVGGLSLTTIETDFGTLNIMMDRMMPQDSIAVVSLEQLQPVFLEVPGKGHFFAEPLAKTGSSDEVQLYGEVGLAFGNERSHGLLTGLAIG